MALSQSTACPARTARVPRLRALALALALALVLSLLWASSALAQRRVEVAFTCTSATFTFSGFPKEKEDTVSARVKSDGVIMADENFTFMGPAGSETLKISVPAGHHLVKAESHWKTNGAVGESGHHTERLTCAAPAPAYSIEKLQAIAGSKLPFTAGPVTGKAGQTVDYEIVVSNTGNLPLILSNFSDPNCDPETILGGQGETPLPPGAETIYTCEHVLSEAGAYTNTASISAKPEGERATIITQTSDTVTVTVDPKPHFEISKLQEITGTKAGYTSSSLTATVGDTVDYEIVVKNNGNETLTFKEFTDLYCDAGTISAPAGTQLRPGESAIYTCSHRLTETGTYFNVASIVGMAEGDEFPEASNLVTVKASEARAPANTSGNPPSTTSPTTTSSTGSAIPGKTPSKPAGTGGVLANKSKHKAKAKARRTSAHKTPKFTG